MTGAGAEAWGAGAGAGSGAGLLDAVRQRLAASGAEPTPARVAAALRAQGRLLGDAEVLGAAEELRCELIGTGPLEPLLADPAVTDVLVSAPDRVWVDRGTGLERAPVAFPDAAAVRRLAQRLAAVAGRRLDDARPWVDARLPDGTRMHAVLPPVAVGSTCLSLRVVRPRAFSLEELVAAGTVPPDGAPILRALIDARVSYLVSGGTGTGKTTLLASLLGLVGERERIVLAEDSAELRPDHPHVVRLEARPPNQEGAGLVTLRDLVRQALRMRPDRLVVGEVRGGEAVDLLAALNTGHEGECLPKPYIEPCSTHGETPPMRRGGSAQTGPDSALQGRAQPLADLGAGRPVSGRTAEHVRDEAPQRSGHVHGAVRARHDGPPLFLPGCVVRVVHVPPPRRADEQCRSQRVHVRFRRRRRRPRVQHAGRDFRRFVVDETAPVREVIGAGNPPPTGQRQVDQERPGRLPQEEMRGLYVPVHPSHPVQPRQGHSARQGFSEIRLGLAVPAWRPPVVEAVAASPRLSAPRAVFPLPAENPFMGELSQNGGFTGRCQRGPCVRPTRVAHFHRVGTGLGLDLPYGRPAPVEDQFGGAGIEELQRTVRRAVGAIENHASPSNGRAGPRS